MELQKIRISPEMRKVSSYIATALERPLPPQVDESGKHHLLDTLAAMISGSRLIPGARAIDYVKRLGGARQATVIGSGILTSPVNAALANGMMAHADETDDSHTRSQTHPGCGVVPAALAIAETQRCSGRNLLRAVVLGYDICTRVTMALGPWDLLKTGHSSRSIGPVFGAAAAASALLKLSADQVRHVLSYAAQQTSGVNCWNRDREHIEKAFDFGGMPARNGVTAATAVESGFSGVDDVFSGDKNFFSTFSRNPDPKILMQRLGKDFEIVTTNIKRWTVGSPIQAALDAMASVIAEHRIGADDVAGIKVTVHQTGAVTVRNPKISDINLPYLLAVMLIDGTVTFASAHDQRRMQNSKVLALRKRVEVIGSIAFNRALNRQAILEIKLRNGQQIRHHTRAVRGTAANPMTRTEIETKSLDLMAPVIGVRRAKRLIDTVWRIEDVPDVRGLRPMLRA